MRANYVPREPNDPDTVDRLVRENWVFAQRRACWHIRRERTQDCDALLSDTYLGLLKAARNYNEKRGVSFISYAQTRIDGEIVDGYRQRLGRYGEKMTLCEEAIPEVESGIIDRGYEKLEERSTVEHIHRLFATLTPVEQDVMRQMYVQGKTQRDVANARHVTESAVCISHRNAVRKLRLRLGLKGDAKEKGRPRGRHLNPKSNMIRDGFVMPPHKIAARARRRRESP